MKENEDQNNMTEPSVAEANKTLRVLKGEKMKFTITIHFKDGKSVELQANEKQTIQYHDDTRMIWVNVGYGNPFCREDLVSFMTCEENPK